MNYITHGARFGGHTSFSAGAPMTDDDLRRVAPSIFAAERHESRSERYMHIPTFELLAALRAHGFVPVRAIQGNSRTEGKAEFTKHMVRFQHPDHAARSRMGGVAPEVVLLNSHDGTSAYRVMSGVFRSICTNSMIVMESGATDVRVPHKGDITGRVIEASFEIVKSAELTIDRAEVWQGITLNSDEREIMAEAAHLVRFGETEADVPVAIPPLKLLGARRQEDRGHDLWRTHNVLQENVLKGGLHGWARDETGKRRRTTMREVKAIDGDIKLNRALWMLSERMAALKGVAA